MTPGPRGRNATLVRTLRIAKAVEGQTKLRSLESLATTLGVSTRTIHRDLRALEDAGWPVPEFLYHPRTRKDMTR